MGGEGIGYRKPTGNLTLTILAGVATWQREIMLECRRESIVYRRHNFHCISRTNKERFPEGTWLAASCGL